MVRVSDVWRLIGRSDVNAEAKPRTLPGPATEGPYDRAIARLRATATWVAGALGAVATIMLAGTQLSNIGQLSPETEPGRLALAAGGIAVGVAAVLRAIYLLSSAQMPVESHLEVLDQAAKNPESQLARAAEANKYFTRGRPDLAHLLQDLRKARTLFDESRVAFTVAEDKVLDASAEELETAIESQERAAKRVAIMETRLDDLLKGVRALNELGAYLGVKAKLERVLPEVLAMSIIAAGCFVIFAWAANPPASTASSDAVSASPVAARLKLTPDAAAAHASVLGAKCAAAASELTDGIDVVALASSGDKVTVVTVPSGPCPTPTTLTLDAMFVISEQEVSTR